MEDMSLKKRSSRAMALLTALLLSVSAVAAIAPVASAEPFENGTTIAPLSTGVYSVASCYQDGKIYLAGGLPSPIRDTLYIYDIATGETTRGAKMTHGTDYPYFAQMPDGRLFVIGGFNTTGIVQVYNPTSDSWSVTSNPTPVVMRWGTAAVGGDGMIYCFGGSPYRNSTFIYDPTSDSWEYGADIPVPVAAGKAVAISPTKMLLIGGTDDTFTTRDTVQIYDTAADSWSSAAPMLQATASSSAVLARNGCVYVFGGSQSQYTNDPVYSSIQRYDVVADEWAYADIGLATPRGGLAGAAMDEYGRIFIAGGYDGSFASDEVEMFVVGDIATPYSLEISSPSDGSYVNGNVSVVANMVNSGWSYYMLADFLVDGVLVESRFSASSTVTFMWDTAGLEDGSVHELTVRAYFWDGSLFEDSVTVTVTTISLEEMIADLEGQVADLKAAMDASNATQIAQLAALLAALNALEEQLAAQDNMIETLEDKADSASMWAMLTMVLVVVVLVLLALMFMMGRKKAA